MLKHMYQLHRLLNQDIMWYCEGVKDMSRNEARRHGKGWSLGSSTVAAPTYKFLLVMGIQERIPSVIMAGKVTYSGLTESTLYWQITNLPQGRKL